jgi:membrane carboxypeptidase/penicillin-binding protein
MPYIGEIVRNQMYEQYGEDAYNNGYQVRTTIDSHLQTLAEDTLRSSLHRFDERRQFRPIRERVDLAQYATETDWDKQLALFGKLGYTEPALILTLKNGAAGGLSRLREADESERGFSELGASLAGSAPAEERGGQWQGVGAGRCRFACAMRALA